jgi:hypothetical protein
MAIHPCSEERGILAFSRKPMKRLFRPDLQDQIVLESHGLRDRAGLVSAGFACYLDKHLGAFVIDTPVELPVYSGTKK